MDFYRYLWYFNGNYWNKWNKRYLWMVLVLMVPRGMGPIPSSVVQPQTTTTPQKGRMTNVKLLQGNIKWGITTDHWCCSHTYQGFLLGPILNVLAFEFKRDKWWLQHVLSIQSAFMISWSYIWAFHPTTAINNICHERLIFTRANDNAWYRLLDNTGNGGGIPSLGQDAGAERFGVGWSFDLCCSGKTLDIREKEWSNTV